MTARPLYATPRTPTVRRWRARRRRSPSCSTSTSWPGSRTPSNCSPRLDETGLYAYSDATLLVPRQSASPPRCSSCSSSAALGTPGSRCGYGAQNLKDARKMLLEVWVPLLDASPLKGTYKVRSANGPRPSDLQRERDRAARLDVDQGPARAGLGLRVLDEAFSKSTAGSRSRSCPPSPLAPSGPRACSGSSSPPPAPGPHRRTCSSASRPGANWSTQGSRRERPTSNTAPRTAPTTPTPRSGQRATRRSASPSPRTP